jgi:phage tail-like protein
MPAACSVKSAASLRRWTSKTVKEGGENRFVHRLPAPVKHPLLVLRRGVLPMSSPWVAWCRDVLEGGPAAPVTTSLIHVSLLDENGQPLRVWSFDKAFPVKWEVEPFQSSKCEIAVEKLELSYQFCKREDPVRGFGVDV